MAIALKLLLQTTIHFTHLKMLCHVIAFPKRRHCEERRQQYVTVLDETGL